MRRFTTILCSIAFLIGGILLVYTENAKTNWSYKTMNANPIPVVPITPITTTYKEPIVVHDTIRDTIHSTTPLEVTIVAENKKTKRRFSTPYKQKKKVFEPDTMPTQAKIDIDTLYVSKPVILIPTNNDTTTIAK